MTIIHIFIFALGAIIGSFLNVVIDRWHTGKGFGGRSQCDSTGKTLCWYELVPVFSYFLQGGRSRHSKAPLSIQYPLVEAGTGFVFLLIFQKFWPVSFVAPADFMFGFLFYSFIFSILIAVFAYDTKHQIIPDWFVWKFNILAFLNIVFFAPELLNLVAGPIVALPLFLLWAASKGKWIGFGDVKLMLGLGWLLGISGGFAALLLSFWIGAAFGIVYLLVKGARRNVSLPFGPFMIAAGFLVFLYNLDMSFLARVFSSIM